MKVAATTVAALLTCIAKHGASACDGLVSRSAGGPALLPETNAIEILSWLDWEETQLRPAVLSQDAAGIQVAVHQLQSALGSNAYLVGGGLTLADVVIYVAFFPLQVSKIL